MFLVGGGGVFRCGGGGPGVGGRGGGSGGSGGGGGGGRRVTFGVVNRTSRNYNRGALRIFKDL